MTTTTITRPIVSWISRVASTKPMMVVLALSLGLGVGLLIASPSGEMVASIVLMLVPLTIILIDPLLGIVTWLMLEPFSQFIYLDIKFGASVPDISLARFTIAVTLAMLLAQAAIGRRRLTRMTLLEWAMVLTMIGIGQSVANGRNLSSDLQHFFDYIVVPFLVFYIAKNLVTDRRSLNRVLAAVFIIGLYAAVYGVYTQLTGNVYFVSAEALKINSAYYSTHLRIMRGLLGAPHIFGMAFNLAIPVTFYFLLKAPSRTRKVLYAAALAALMLAMFLTYKRTAWIAMLGSFAVIQFFYPQFRRLFYVLLVAAVVLVALNIDEVNNSAVVTERLNAKTDSLNGRTERWDVAAQLWQERPIAGQGYNKFSALNDQYTAIESQYWNILVSAGLLGFAPYVLMMILIVRDSLAQYRRTRNGALVSKELIVVFWGVMAAYLISMYTVVLNSHLMHNLFFLLLGAIVGSQSHLIERRTEDKNTLASGHGEQG